MLNRSTALILLFLLASTFPSQATAEPLPPANQWIPPEAVIALEVSKPEALLDLAFDPRVMATVKELPAYKAQVSQPGFQQFLAVVTYLETRLGTDWKTGIGNLVGGGLTFAVLPDDAVLLMVDAKDARMLEELHEILLTFAGGDAAEKKKSVGIRSAEYRGVTGWSYGPDEAHAIVGNRLLMSNKPDVLKRVLDLRDQTRAKSLATLPAYQAARKAADPHAAAMLFANMEVFKQNPEFQNALAGGGNPLVELLLAGVTEALRDSSWLAFDLQINRDTLSIDVAVDAQVADVDSVASFALPTKADEGAMPMMSVPRTVAGLSLYRDLHAFYAAKDQLFPERTSGLIFFENMMGIFFSGRDLTEEVLAETQPEVRIVVAEQQYDPDIGTPRVQIPAFAAVFRLRDPDHFREVAEEAWQKALGLINFTRGQQGLPGLIIDRPTHGDTTFTAAHFASTDVKDSNALDTHFNFRPALAMLDDYLIFSSTEGLTRDLIDAVEKQGDQLARPLAEKHSLIEIDGVRLASILQANRANLVRQNMIEEGHTKEQAETEIDMLLTIVQYIGQLKLTVGAHDGQPQANLQVTLNLPSP